MHTTSQKNYCGVCGATALGIYSFVEAARAEHPSHARGTCSESQQIQPSSKGFKVEVAETESLRLLVQIWLYVPAAHIGFKLSTDGLRCKLAEQSPTRERQLCDRVVFYTKQQCIRAKTGTRSRTCRPAGSNLTFDVQLLLQRAALLCYIQLPCPIGTLTATSVVICGNSASSRSGELGALCARRSLAYELGFQSQLLAPGPLRQPLTVIGAPVV
eukprot:IDg5848t1